MRTIAKAAWCLFAALLLGSGQGQEATPEVLVKNVTLEGVDLIAKDKEIRGNRNKLIELINEKVLPHFNFTGMTALAMGQSWNKADAEQKKRLTEEFKTLLVREEPHARSRRGAAEMIGREGRRIIVSGPVTLANVARLLEEGRRHLEEGVQSVDLGEVTEMDSSLLALLLAWLRDAKARQQEVSFTNLPESLQTIARLYGVDRLLPAAAPHH